MRTLWDITVTGVFAVLLTVTVLHNSGVRGHAVETIRRLGLIPKWTFFAPDPATSDLQLLYRDLFTDGQCSQWRAVADLSKPRPLSTMVWNPKKRLRKAIRDIVVSFPFGEAETRPEMLKLSQPYLLVLSYVSQLPRLPGPNATQFMIMEQTQATKARLVLCSEAHHL